MVKAQRSFVKTNLKIPVCRTESISIAVMHYGVWLLMFAKRNRRKPAVDEVPSAAGFAWAIPNNSAARRVMPFPPSANREMGAGTNETGRSPLLFFCCTDVDEGTDFVLS